MEEEINKDINKQWGVSESMITFAGQTPEQHLFSWKTDSRRENERRPVSKIVIIKILTDSLVVLLRQSYWFAGRQQKKTNK